MSPPGGAQDYPKNKRSDASSRRPRFFFGPIALETVGSSYRDGGHVGRASLRKLLSLGCNEAPIGLGANDPPLVPSLPGLHHHAVRDATMTQVLAHRHGYSRHARSDNGKRMRVG